MLSRSLASLTKRFTATAVMLLVADHRLRYDDDITTLVARLPAFARGVTVRQLLTHTGGLPDAVTLLASAVALSSRRRGANVA